MTVIRPLSQGDKALQEKVRNATKKAHLNLSETMALNKKFGLNLEYTPENDIIQTTIFIRRGAEKPDSFAKECAEEANALVSATDKCRGFKVVHSSISSFEGNIKNALSKMKKVLK